MRDISSTNNNHIFAEIVSFVEINDHVAVDLSYVVNVSEDRLAHHVFSVDVVINIFHEGLFGILISGF